MRKSKPQQNQQRRKRYHSDPDYRAKEIERARVTLFQNNAKKHVYLNEFRARGCFFCGESESVCLDAHHKDPSQKDGTIGDMIRNRTGLERFRTELDKCVCVCKNCHAKLHENLIFLPIDASGSTQES